VVLPLSSGSWRGHGDRNASRRQPNLGASDTLNATREPSVHRGVAKKRYLPRSSRPRRSEDAAPFDARNRNAPNSGEMHDAKCLMSAPLRQALLSMRGTICETCKPQSMSPFRRVFSRRVLGRTSTDDITGLKVVCPCDVRRHLSRPTPTSPFGPRGFGIDEIEIGASLRAN
jgi:hypothetical protein